MPLLIDLASATRRLAPDEFASWAATRTIFLSSEMRELGELRRQVAASLRELGFTVMMFEDLGGRDEDAQLAYLEGVARSDIYLGLVADRYGKMQASGRSPTHDEYLEARARGKRISFWIASDGAGRQGHAMDFVQEVQAFHTTGQFDDAGDLATRLIQRLAEIAADDQAPWVKLGAACFRASRIRDEGARLAVEAEVRDIAVARALEALRSDGFGHPAEVPVALADRAGQARVLAVVSETRTASIRDVEIAAEVTWAEGRGGSLDSGFNGLSPDELVETGLRAGLLGEPLPQQVSGTYDFMVDATDPLAELEGLRLSPAVEEAVGALLLSERLLGTGRASYIERFALGPAHLGRRRVELVYVEPRRYTNVTPAERRIEGTRVPLA